MVTSSGGRPDRQARERRAVLVAAGALGLLAVAVVWVLLDLPGPTRLTAAGIPLPETVTEQQTPPDLSTMSPREQFDRLYNRVMRAAEQGDTATVSRFSPMAFQAYENLGAVDADARYHAAVLRLHVARDTGAALRLADSIQASNPGHLFIFLIRGTVGRLAGDTGLLARANAGFLAAWEAEMKSGRPEYKDHQVMLDQFREMAVRPGGAGRPQ
jgi:hypothetical protein